jgi:hypothetical protein
MDSFREAMDENSMDYENLVIESELRPFQNGAFSTPSVGQQAYTALFERDFSQRERDRIDYNLRRKRNRRWEKLYQDTVARNR